jgi:hypothetical protein
MENGKGIYCMDNRNTDHMYVSMVSKNVWYLCMFGIDVSVDVCMCEWLSGWTYNLHK